MSRNIIRLCVIALAMIPFSASAHVGAGDTHSFANGFAHPLAGLDHILAMIAVGLLAVQLGGRALWLVPLTFLSIMAMSGLLGAASMWLPFVEIGIGMSVVVLGLAIAFQLNLPTVAAMSLVGFFTIFHGYMHGAEIADGMHALTYGIGFLCATALLHVTGIGLGTAIGRRGKQSSRRILQVSGYAMAIAGTAILAGVF